MKRFDGRIIVGLLLILGGGLLLAQQMGLLISATDVFWGIVFLLGGAAFLYEYATGQWWGAIPGMTLIGIAGAILLPEPLGGMAVLGGIGLAFWLVYLGDRQERWWAIIPGGVMVTLALVAGVSDLVGGMETGSIFFLGMALTFLLVALLTRMRWAYWPAAALGLLGVLLITPFFDLANYIWAVALVLGGGYLIFKAFRKSES
jgi:hypothetical protein